MEARVVHELQPLPPSVCILSLEARPAKQGTNILQELQGFYPFTHISVVLQLARTQLLRAVLVTLVMFW